MSYVEFSELEFKWSFHVIGSLNQVHVIHTLFSYCFTFERLIYIIALRSVITSHMHATTNMVICIPAEISTYYNAWYNTNETIYRAAIT